MNDDQLVPVISSERLLVEPIWEKPIDALEGPLYQQYVKEHPNYQLQVRSTVQIRLQQAAIKLLPGFTLVVRAGHRPLVVQYQLLRVVQHEYQQNNPQASEEAALAFARTYVSDPSIKIPPHCAGAAVDVDVLNTNTGQLLDFGCPVNTDSEIASLSTKNITRQQRANRNMLHTAMYSAGFASYDPEWWHFSYGDQAWADAYSKPAAIYTLIEV